ncbi:MAG TPA: peptidylprolyl isomerase, partial [Thermoanaerobaculia bacterium]
VAKVNGIEVKKDELLKEATGLQQQLGQMGRPPEAPDAAFYRQVLDGMVARVLLQQEAQAEGIAVTDADTKGQIDALRSRFPSQEAFTQALAAQGMKETDLVARAKDAFMVQKFIETKILPTVNISDEAAKTFYDQNQDKMQRPEQVHVRHILVRVDKTAPEADRKKAKEKAQGLLDQVKKGGDFAKLATDNSDDPGSKTRGGDLSWVSKGQTVEPFEKAAFALQKPNDISQLVESDFGYHIIQLLEKRPAGVVPFPEAKDRIANFLKQKQAQEKVQARIQELRTKGKVEIFI